MSDAWRIMVRRTGGPEVLEREAFAPAAPSAGEVRLRTTAIGVNFIDVYHRSGLYPLTLPTGIGSECVGVVDAIGEGVTTLRQGDRVATLATTPGTFATHVTIPAQSVMHVPDGIADDVAAAALLKGLTAWMLVERIAHAGPDTRVLVHAAAGGVGSIAVQWLKALGAFVIAHAGTPDKAKVAAGLGADHALACPMDALADEVRALTGGEGVDAVLDGVGEASWAASLGATARCGIIASYGNASGPVPPVAPSELLRAGSLFLTRPSVFDYIRKPADREAGTSRLFALLGSGAVRAAIGQRFALADAAQAHRALEARETTGSTILLP